MTPPTRRRFDATWLPFGMMLGFVIGVGIGLSIIDNLLVGAVIGFLVGAGLGVVLGFRRGGGSGVTDEDAEDDLYRQQYGDPGPTDGGPGHRSPTDRR